MNTDTVVKMAAGTGGQDPSDSPQDEAERAERLARRQGRLDAVGQSLMTDLAEAISWRSDSEEQWLSDLAQFESGQSPLSPAKEERRVSSAAEADYRRTGDNITRPAVLLATSRVSDMLFPTSDRNWDITPSPDAKVPGFVPPEPEVGEDGQPIQLTPKQLEASEQKLAEERCEAMRTQIDDQLQEANYDGIGRDVIFDAMLYGTGVMKGPFPRNKLCRKPDPVTGKWTRQYEETPSATATYVDLFQFYPMPCRNIKECPGVFELNLMTRGGLRALAKDPGFSKTQISRALKTSGRFGGLAQSPLFRRAQGSTSQSVLLTLENRYAVWNYSGDMDGDTVIEFTQGLLEEASISEEQAAEVIATIAGDDLLSVACDVWFVNGIVIKLVLRSVDDNTVMYHVYNYEKRPDTVFGKGLPYVLREDQLAANQLWQAMMLNAMMSAGLQIAMRKGALDAPEGRSYDMTFTRPRVWEFNEEIDDIRKAFQAWEVPSIIDKIMPMYERSKQNAQEHALLPAIAQGDATSSTQTSSGLSMLMNAANIVTRQLAKSWDDDITTPLMNAMYDWNLANGKDEAKGDYVVIPRGVSHLLVKDVQAQRYLFALQTYSANPEMAKRMKWGEWARMGMVVMEMDAEKLMKPEDVVKQEDEAAAQNPPQDPRILAEQNRGKQIENDFAIKQQELQQRAAEFAAKNETDRWEAASRERVAQLNYQAALAGLDKAERSEMERINADLQKDSMWGRIEIEKLAEKRRADQFEAQVEANREPGPVLA
jgi:hypothetical protein